MPEDASLPGLVKVWLNGSAIDLAKGSMAITAFLITGTPCRVTASNGPRTGLCGMGICFECRAIVDGVPHRPTCQLPCREGMRLETQP